MVKNENEIELKINTFKEKHVELKTNKNMLRSYIITLLKLTLGTSSEVYSYLPVPLDETHLDVLRELI